MPNHCSRAGATALLLVIGAPAFAQNPLTEAPAVPVAPAGEAAPLAADPDATAIIRALAPISGGNPGAPVVRDVDADGGRRKLRVDYSRAIDLTVYFDYDSADLTPEAKRQLAPLGMALSGPALLPHRFLIAGHTDGAGDATYNRLLSLRRAASVRAHLVSAFGIDPARLVAHGWGFSRLKNPTAPLSGVNRRVEVALIAQGPLSHFEVPARTILAQRLPVRVDVGAVYTRVVEGEGPASRLVLIRHPAPAPVRARFAPAWRGEVEGAMSIDSTPTGFWPAEGGDPRHALAPDALDDFSATPTALPRGASALRRRETPSAPPKVW